LAFAGIYEFWRRPSASEEESGLYSTCILTCEANSTISAIHDRMPVILAASDWSAWMNADTDPELLDSLMVPASADLLEMYPVSTDVNSSRNHGAQLLLRVEPVPIGESPGQGTLL
jgi:hypothetical protein